MKTVLRTTTAAVAALTLLGTCHLATAPSVQASAPRPTAGGKPDTLVATPSASTIRWAGARGAPGGTVALASGMFVIRHEKLLVGDFTIDMRTLAVGEVPVAGVTRRALRAHLTGPAFFDVDRHPQATFTSRGMERVGPARWRIDGDLRLHGVSQPLSLETDVRWVGTGHMVATSSFTINRRRWAVGTDGAAAGVAIPDEMRVTVTLDARRPAPAVAAR
jgi:polyisoprenoid-binding protein YceI